MARPKPTPAPAAKVAYVVKGDGWLAGTYREDGATVYMTPAEARVFEMSFRVATKDTADKAPAAKAPAETAAPEKAKEPAPAVEAPKVADEHEPAADEPASHAEEPAGHADEHAAS